MLSRVGEELVLGQTTGVLQAMASSGDNLRQRCVAELCAIRAQKGNLYLCTFCLTTTCREL